MSGVKKYLCVHGHFYQPPRENPWLETIERQESAAPFHDWNDRIHFECYQPNAFSRIYDDHGKILDLVNNYELISFNFGPTLLSWLEQKKPETYRQILRADQNSLKQNQGAGNAIAQVYNHMILPLANRRDKITQVKWGIEDFKYRFGHKPESIWLSETACNEETLEVLVEEGVKFIILAPIQAEAIRDLNKEDWIDVSHSNINPKEPYRCFLKKDPKRYIDIFFYDGPISQAVSFDTILDHSKQFLDRLEMAVDHSIQGPQLIHLATDGETYGHHKKFGDRVLAYLLKEAAPNQGYTLVNYSQFLSLVPPKKTVRLKEGENGEGTSWSCAHGVLRWKDDCGCHTGGPDDWNQKWRKPLRDALDWLRDKVCEIYEKEGARYFRDVWEARNQYIHVVLNRNTSSIKQFFQNQTKTTLTPKQFNTALQLLEMQRHAMLMYTSCGWFFSELSGIETVQIMQYAARAIQLATRVSNQNIEEPFLKKLAQAKSNLPELKDGEQIYQGQVKPRLVSLAKVAGYYALHSIFKELSDEEKNNFYCFSLDILEKRKESFENSTLNFGRLKVLSKITHSEGDYLFTGLQLGPYDFRCYAKKCTDEEAVETIEKELFEAFHLSHMVDLIKVIESRFGRDYFTLKDLPEEWRTQIVNHAAKESMDKMHVIYQQLYNENRRLHEAYNAVNLPIPKELKNISELTLQKKTEMIIDELALEGFDLKSAKKLDPYLSLAEKTGLNLNKMGIQEKLTEKLSSKSASLLLTPNGETLTEIANILKLAKKMGIELDKQQAQDHFFLILKRMAEEVEWKKRLSSETKQKIIKLAKELDFR